MRLGAAVRAVGRVFRDRPTDLLPFYVLGAAVSTMAQAVGILGLVTATLYLAATGRIAAVREGFDQIDSSPPDPEAEPEAFEAWMESVGAAVEPAFTPLVVLVVVLTVLALIVVVVVGYAAVSAGQLSTCRARLRDERGLTAGVAGVRRYWLSFLGLYLLEFGLWIAISIAAVVLGGIGVLLVGVGGVAVLVGAIFLLVATLGWLLAAIAIRAIFAFAPVGVVVDDVGAVRGASNAAGYVRTHLVEAGFYYAVAIGALIGIGLLTSAFATVGVASGSALLSIFLVWPALDLLKTTLYGGGRGILSPPPAADRSLRSQLTDGLRRGWRELASFVRATPGLHAASAGTLLVGFAMGWLAAGPLVGTVETSIAGRLEGHLAPAATLEFFGNNWSVALTMAFGGILAGIPALSSLWVNGVVLGLYGRLEVAPLELLAFVTPHGLFEIPAIIVSGAVGLYLGANWWRTWRGAATRVELADAIERAFWVLVGVGVLLAIAAVIEGFVSPYYWRPFL